MNFEPWGRCHLSLISPSSGGSPVHLRLCTKRSRMHSFIHLFFRSFIHFYTLWDRVIIHLNFLYFNLYVYCIFSLFEIVIWTNQITAVGGSRNWFIVNWISVIFWKMSFVSQVQSIEFSFIIGSSHTFLWVPVMLYFGETVKPVKHTMLAFYDLWVSVNVRECHTHCLKSLLSDPALAPPLSGYKNTTKNDNIWTEICSGMHH